jgi:hypothetical protein
VGLQSIGPEDIILKRERQRERERERERERGKKKLMVGVRDFFIGCYIKLYHMKLLLGKEDLGWEK